MKESLNIVVKNFDEYLLEMEGSNRAERLKNIVHHCTQDLSKLQLRLEALLNWDKVYINLEQLDRFLLKNSDMYKLIYDDLFKYINGFKGNSLDYLKELV